MKKMTQPLKGFRDFLPEEALKRQWLIDKIRQVFELWGYDPLETPTLEPLELFQGQIGEDEKLFFQFKEQGGRDVALRYDQTVPASRVVGRLNQQLPMPFKRYQIQTAFRAEKPQKGRYREFLQLDADIFGDSSPIADAEVIALSLDIYRTLGFPTARALINDRALFKGIPYRAIASIDKLKKLGPDGVIKDMKKKGISADKAQEFLSVIDKIKPNETLQTIFNYLKSQGFNKDWYEFDPTIARSFSYSTGVIWEIEIPGWREQSVLGGERYDQLIKKLTGQNIPATGFAVGFDRTFEAAIDLNLIPDIKTSTTALVTVFNNESMEQSLKITKQLREAYINTEVFSNPDTKLDKQLKYADKKGIPFVVIVGPDEIKENKLQLKDMISGEQTKLTLDELIDELTI